MPLNLISATRKINTNLQQVLLQYRLRLQRNTKNRLVLRSKSSIEMLGSFFVIIDNVVKF